MAPCLSSASWYWPILVETRRGYDERIADLREMVLGMVYFFVRTYVFRYFLFFFFFHWRYSPLWALACRTIPLHLSLSITKSLHLLTPSTWRSLSTSSLHHFLGLPLRLVPSSSWVKIFLVILSSSILSRWPSQLILRPFIHFTIFSRLVNSSSSRFVLLFHSPSSYLVPYILLNIFLSKISKAISLLINNKIFWNAIRKCQSL